MCVCTGDAAGYCYVHLAQHVPWDTGVGSVMLPRDLEATPFAGYYLVRTKGSQNSFP